jgi:hypothetical protein
MAAAHAAVPAAAKVLGFHIMQGTSRLDIPVTPCGMLPHCRIAVLMGQGHMAQKYHPLIDSIGEAAADSLGACKKSDA